MIWSFPRVYVKRGCLEIKIGEKSFMRVAVYLSGSVFGPETVHWKRPECLQGCVRCEERLPFAEN